MFRTQRLHFLSVRQQPVSASEPRCLDAPSCFQSDAFITASWADSHRVPEVTSVKSPAQRPARRREETMSVDLLSLVVMWLLTRGAAVTPGQNNSTHVTEPVTPHEFTRDQLTTREATTGWSPVLEVAGRHATQRLVVQENGTKPSGDPMLQTRPSTKFLPGTQTAGTQTAASPRFKDSTEGRKPTTEIPSDFTATSHAGNPTETTRAPPTPSSSAQTPSAADETTQASTRPTPSTRLISTTDTSTQPVEHKTTSPSPVRATPPPGLYRTSKDSTKTASVYNAKTRETRPGKKEKPVKGSHHGKIVAGLIGGALLVMVVGFLLIYIKKRTLQRQQITTQDWAGPSPFLEGGANNGQASMRASNRISLSSFLNRRLSRTLSMLPETGEELEAIVPASTFGRKDQESSFGREDDGIAGPESDGIAGPEGDGIARPKGNGNAGPEGDGNAGPEGDGNAGPEGDGNAGPEGNGNAGPEGNGNAGPEGNGNARPESNGNARPESNGNAGPEGNGTTGLGPQMKANGDVPESFLLAAPP